MIASRQLKRIKLVPELNKIFTVEDEIKDEYDSLGDDIFNEFKNYERDIGYLNLSVPNPTHKFRHNFSLTSMSLVDDLMV